MEAILFAAGLGTRLRPLTDNRPKALVNVMGRTLLEINIENLVRQGATHIIINTHHHSEQLRQFVSNYNASIPLTLSDESKLLLDTGGALRKIAHDHLLQTDGPYLLYNVDVLSSINLTEMIKEHKNSNTLATLATSVRATDRQLLFDNGRNLCGWHNRKTGEYRWSCPNVKSPQEMAYSGIAAVSAEFMSLMAAEEDEVFSLTTALLHYAKIYSIGFFLHSPDEWLDVGKPETLKKAQSFLESIQQ